VTRKLRAAEGPHEVAQTALVILEGMRGKPVDEEIADVIRDACWTAYGNGLANGKRAARAPGAEEGR
jgi:hypothetical protein